MAATTSDAVTRGMQLHAAYGWSKPGIPHPASPRALVSTHPGALNDNNSTEFLENLGGLLAPGPTLTKVNDFQAILVDSR
jgi:hypothetical protein